MTALLTTNRCARTPFDQRPRRWMRAVLFGDRRARAWTAYAPVAAIPTRLVAGRSDDPEPSSTTTRVGDDHLPPP